MGGQTLGRHPLAAAPRRRLQRPAPHYRHQLLDSLGIEQRLLDGLHTIDQRALGPLLLVQQQGLFPLRRELQLPLLGQVPVLGELDLRLELVVARVEGHVLERVGRVLVSRISMAARQERVMRGCASLPLPW